MTEEVTGGDAFMKALRYSQQSRLRRSEKLKPQATPFLKSMTEEVTDAMRDAAWATGGLAAMMIKSELAAIYLAMRSASNSPTTNGEVTPRAASDDEVERLREALTTIANGDEPRPVGKIYRQDGVASKHDQCVHGARMYDDCGQCMAAAARAALSTPTKASAVDDPETAKGGG